MARREPYAFATAFAEKLLRDEFKIDRLPIDPMALARSRGIRVIAMPHDHDGVSGMFIHANGKSAIAYATHIDNKGFQHFSVAHEIGHCFLPGHIDAILPDGASEHFSRSGFISDDRYELEADHFAAGLLMPARLFTRAMETAGDGLDAIERLAGRCKTSLTATAIRYQQLTQEAVSIIQSRGSRIEFCFMSDALLALKPGRWPHKGEPVPRRSVTHRFNADPERVAKAERDADEVQGVDWFGAFPDVELYEEVVGLGRYGRTLTVITTVDALPDEEDDSADSGHDGRWEPRF
jgi:Zn-dependent peptidase ImmA (M78 family)